MLGLYQNLIKIIKNNGEYKYWARRGGRLDLSIIGCTPIVWVASVFFSGI
jgi:hypothetical protein